MQKCHDEERCTLDVSKKKNNSQLYQHLCLGHFQADYLLPVGGALY